MDVVFGHADRVIVLHSGELSRERSAGRDPGRSRVQEGVPGRCLSSPTRCRVRPSPRVFGAEPYARRREVVPARRPTAAGKSTTAQGHHGPRIERTGRNPPSTVSALEPVGTVRDRPRGMATCRGPGIFTELTVAENLEVGRRPARPGLPPGRGAAVRALPSLAAMRDRPASACRRRAEMLAIARTLMGNPLAVLLDEPSEGLARSSSGRWLRLSASSRPRRPERLLCEQNARLARGTGRPQLPDREGPGASGCEPRPAPHHDRACLHTCEEEFNAWYDTEHLASVSRSADSAPARRWSRRRGGPVKANSSPRTADGPGSAALGPSISPDSKARRVDSAALEGRWLRRARAEHHHSGAGRVHGVAPSIGRDNSASAALRAHRARTWRRICLHRRRGRRPARASGIR